MAVGLDLALGPASMFSSIPEKEIKLLVQKPNDKFIIIPASQYSNKVISMVEKSGIPSSYKKYLTELVKYEDDKNRKKILVETMEGHSKQLSETEIEKYFGEVLGPIHLINKATTKFDNVVFPTRTNYQLFDFFMEKDGKYTGYSSKTGAGVSNTLSPTAINERIKKSDRQRFSDRDVLFGKNVMVVLGEAPIVEGLSKVVGLMTKHNKLPTTIDKKVKSALMAVDWDGIASKLQLNKAKKLEDTDIKGIGSIDYFLSNYVIPRTKMSDAIKRGYQTGKKKYTCTNVAYGLGMLIVDSNKDGSFDCSPFLRVLFNDLNVIKLDLVGGVPSWKVKNLSEYTDVVFKFRSKYRWDVVKDKLGIAL